MSDAQDVKMRVHEAWRAAATRAYAAAHGVIDAPADALSHGPSSSPTDGEARPWRWVMSARVSVTLACALLVVGALALWWPRAPHGETVPFPSSAGTMIAGEGTYMELENATVTVHVAGDVHSPGLYDLASGARVAEAIEAAGGAIDPQDLDLINLARPVRDGERIAVGVDEMDGEALVNLNTASEADLVTLPGVGPVLAARIVAHREENGPFTSVDDLDVVSGVGPAVLAGLREDATV